MAGPDHKISPQAKNNLLELVRDGNVKKVIDDLLLMDLSQEQSKQINLIATQYHELKQKQIQGTIPYEQESITKNKIIANLLDVINDLDKAPLSESGAKSVKKSTTTKKVILYVLGLGVIALALWLISIYLPIKEDPSLQLTVYVTDMQGNVLIENDGELNIPIGNRILNKPIGENGRTNFGEIPAKFKDSTITIGFHADGYEILDGQNKFIFTGDPIHLKVKRDNSLGLLKGVVRNSEGAKYLEGVLVKVDDQKTHTNEFGEFELNIPEDKQKERYHITASKDGFRMNSDYFYPQGGMIEIRLQEN